MNPQYYIHHDKEVIKVLPANLRLNQFRQIEVATIVDGKLIWTVDPTYEYIPIEWD